MTERIVMAGWGGQGLMTLGKFVATVAMRLDKHVTWMPAYGAEVRGGTAYCHVIVSDEAIYSPVIAEADTLILMNQPSYDKFHDMVATDGLMLLNSTTIAQEQPHPDVRIIRVPATDIAIRLGNVRVANMVMLGAYRAFKNFLPLEPIQALLAETLTGRRAPLVEMNLKALEAGLKQAHEQK